jgi:hypothetical protein
VRNFIEKYTKIVRDFYVLINDLLLFIKCVRKDLYTGGKCSVRVRARSSLSLSLSLH